MTRWQPKKQAQRAQYYRIIGKPDIAENLEAQLNYKNCCRICGRTLSDPISIDRGIGKDCWKKGHR